MNEYDLLLNSSGDISFEVTSIDSTEQFVFEFHYATSDSLLFSFFPEINGTKEREPEMLQFNFNTYNVLYDKENRLATGNTFLEQAIRLQLETELGTIRENKSVGSDIFKYRHMFMSPNEVVTQIEKCIYNSIKDIVPECEVRVYLRETNYYDFYNAIKVSVILADETMWFTL